MASCEMNGDGAEPSCIVASPARSQNLTLCHCRSDWIATYSTSEALKAGLDLEMPGKTEWRGKLVSRSLHAGKLEVSTVKERARNVLELVEKTHASGVPEDAEEWENNTPEVRAANGKAATESIVLLKNASRILPIRTPG